MYTKCALDFEVHCFFLAQKTAEPEVLLYINSLTNRLTNRGVDGHW